MSAISPRHTIQKVVSSSSSKVRNYPGVYLVEAQKEAGWFAPLAIRPRLFSDHAKWEDTSRGGVKEAIKARKSVYHSPHKLGDLPRKIVLTTPQGYEIKLLLLTAKLYEKNRDFIGNSPDLNSDAEVQKYFLESTFLD